MNDVNFIVKKYDEIGENFIKAGNESKQCEYIGDGKYKFRDFCVEKISKKYKEVINQYITVFNTSDSILKLKQVSSAFVTGIGEGGIMQWNDEKRFKVYYCFNTWQGEGQWRCSSLSEMGLYKASNHNNANVISFRSVGNQSTSKYYPLIFIQDYELGKTWFFEIAASSNWYMEIGANIANNTLYVEMNSAYNNNDNWFVNLVPNDKYVSSPCSYGVVNGGAERAIKALTDYKRNTAMAELDTIPVCFNDYMNCLWAMPSDEKLIPLIDKAAEVGCEVFCIDSGWYKVKDHEEEKLGSYIPGNDRFGTYGFDGIIDYIIKKGLKPGVWLELDSITKNDNIYNEYQDCLLKINGEFAGCNGRYLIDFRKTRVKQYFRNTIDNLYNMGVRFIKNDYNQTSGIGYDGEMGVGENMRQCSLAFYDFIDEIRNKYTDLVIENCASGALRSDAGIMPHFHLLSTSDQEYFYNNPSIVTGTMAYIQPEKCGIWSYPYPLLYRNRNDELQDVFCDSVMGKYSDGEETAYNMITSMLGVMYLSGHIEVADEFNSKLICDAVSVYKSIRGFIKNAYPIYPSGIIRIEKDVFFSFGLTDGEKIIIAVWRNHSQENVEIFDLSNYVSMGMKAKLIYPLSLPTEFNYVNEKLTVKLNNNFSARLFEISKGNGMCTD